MNAKEYYKSTRMVETRNWTLEMTLNFAEEYTDFYNKNIAINAENVKQLMNDLIDKIVEMYVPDGNPEIWLNKIQDLRNDNTLHIDKFNKSLCVVCKTEPTVIKGRCCTCHYDCP